MSGKTPTLLALDFDGVICDGLIEYFVTTKKTYQQIWTPTKQDINRNLDNLAPSFYKLRPVIETGWEMPVLLRALVLAIPEADILADWSAVATKIIITEKLDKKILAQTLDGIRDNSIATDLNSWLQLHRFYPGMIPRLKQVLNSDTQLYIVTTKEGRFVKQLLQQQGLEVATGHIIGKDSKRPKYETLRLLRDSLAGNKNNIWFVEDRIKALQQVQQQPDLTMVRLFLADWGYNIELDRTLANHDPNLQLLSLEQFRQDFRVW